MSLEQGLQIGRSMASMGLGIANQIRQQKKDAQIEQERMRQQEIARVADAILQNPNVDINSLTQDPAVKMGARAQVINMQLRENEKTEAGKRAVLSEMNLDHARLKQAYSAWKAETNPQRKRQLALAMYALTPDGKNAELSKDGSKVKFIITETGETFETPIPTDEEIEQGIMPFLEPKSFIQSYLTQRQARIDYNAKQLMNPEPLYNKKGEIVAYSYEPIDKATGKKKRIYLDEDGNQIPKPKGARKQKEWAMIGSQSREARAQNAEARAAGLYPGRKELQAAQITKAKRGKIEDQKVNIDGQEMTVKEVRDRMKTLEKVLAPKKGDKSSLLLLSENLDVSDAEIQTELDRIQRLAKEGSGAVKSAAKQYIKLVKALFPEIDKDSGGGASASSEEIAKQTIQKYLKGQK